MTCPVCESAAQFCNLSHADILLMSGELTAGELRAVKAMLESRYRAIRAACRHEGMVDEPTEAMLEAGAQVRISLRMGDIGIAGHIGKEVARDCYKAMLTASKSNPASPPNSAAPDVEKVIEELESRAANVRQFRNDMHEDMAEEFSELDKAICELRAALKGEKR